MISALILEARKRHPLQPASYPTGLKTWRGYPQQLVSLTCTSTCVLTSESFATSVGSRTANRAFESYYSRGDCWKEWSRVGKRKVLQIAIRVPGPFWQQDSLPGGNSHIWPVRRGSLRSCSSRLLSVTDWSGKMTCTLQPTWPVSKQSSISGFGLHLLHVYNTENGYEV